MSLLKKYFGVTFLPRVVGANKFRAQINRQGTILNLGMFPDPKEAADAYDNASWHLRDWAEYSPQYNTEDVDSLRDSIPNEATTRALAKLRQRFPNFEQEKIVNDALTELQKAEKTGAMAVEGTIEHMKQVRVAMAWSFAQIKLLEVQLGQANRKIKDLELVAQGLRATGGHNPFTPIPKPVAGGETPVRTAAPLVMPEVPLAEQHLGN